MKTWKKHLTLGSHPGCNFFVNLLIAAWMAVAALGSYAQGYKSIEIIHIKPVDILPIIWQVEAGDKNVYKYIEHLRVAEATRITDMMWKYGAGNYSAEEYKQLMMRLNTWMTLECPLWYDNYEVIWWPRDVSPSDHAHTERNTLNTLVNHSNFKVVLTGNRQQALTEFVNNNPNSINIFWNSTYTYASNKNDYNETVNEQNVKDLCKLNNFIIFAAGTNIGRDEWHLRNKIYNGEYEADEYGRYSLASMANSDKNTQPNSHLLVTIATNKNWDIDQTNETYESSKFPVWFKNNILFSGRAFPRHSTMGWWRIEAESWKYATSHTNYVNVAMTDLCFQMFAEVKDADELLEMIRSTCLTDYIHLNWETQELQLINPAWFFQRYLMPNNLPSSVKTAGTVSLGKGYYKGIVFDIPGAEVKIDGQWIAYSDQNKKIIKAQNPFFLEWRINGDLCKKMGYESSKSVTGSIIVVDDQWNGLNMTKDFSITLTP